MRNTHCNSSLVKIPHRHSCLVELQRTILIFSMKLATEVANHKKCNENGTKRGRRKNNGDYDYSQVFVVDNGCMGTSTIGRVDQQLSNVKSALRVTQVCVIFCMFAGCKRYN